MVLIRFEDGNIGSELARNTGITYNYTTKIIKLMINYQIIQHVEGKNRRIKQLCLTEKGKVFQEYSIKLLNIFKEQEEQKVLEQQIRQKPNIPDKEKKQNRRKKKNV